MKKIILTSLAFLLLSVVSKAQTPCSQGIVDGTGSAGSASGYACRGIDLQSYTTYNSMNATNLSGIQGNDSWGWTDVRDGKEYALIGLTNGLYFLDISDPVNPRRLGRLPKPSGSNSTFWSDVKTYENWAFIVSESTNFGMQIYDLNHLQGLSTNANRVFNLTTEASANRYSHVTTTTVSSPLRDSHNIIINEDAGTICVLGATINLSGTSNDRNGGPVFYDINTSTSPPTITYTGYYGNLGYTHDAQVVTYDGPDTDYTGREIMVVSNGEQGGFSNEIAIVDITNKPTFSFISNLTGIGGIGYNASYIHQGWFTEDKKYFIVGDEIDEEDAAAIGGDINTRTAVYNVEDLDNPFVQFIYYGRTGAIDHNGYVRGERFYMANYRAGLTIKRLHKIDDAITPGSDVDDALDGTTGNMVEEAYFDTYTPSNGPSFNGAWNVYPYFESGNIIISNLEGGVMIVKQQNYDNTPPVADNSAYTATLDKATGSVTVTPADISASSTDNVGITKRTITAGQTTFTCADVGQTFNISFEVEDDFGLKDTATRAVTVEAEETRYNSSASDITTNGAWTNGVPGPGSNAFIRADATLTSGNGIDACTCRIRNSRTLTVNAGAYLNVEGDLNVNGGTLTVEHQGIVKQGLEDAVTVKTTGAINVEITTPFMKPRDFLIMGSPMDTETRTGVFTDAFLVLNNDPFNFIPASGISTVNGTNFADDNGDDWTTYTGAINRGEGYLVRPQSSYTDGNATYDMTHTAGVLNSGLVTRPVVFNGFGPNPDGTPNIVANPYASPISTSAFLIENPNIGTVYFWEHLTPPNFSIPGHVGLRFDMDDISFRNMSGGTKAAKDMTMPADPDHTAPDDFISTGQGFSFFANDLTGDINGDIRFTNAMRRTTNNNTLTRPANVDRVWLDVRLDRYEIGSSALMAFNPIATPLFDFGYDTERLATVVSLYTITEDGQKKLGIQTREGLEDNMVIKLGFSTQISDDSEYTLSISDFDGGLMEGATVYLIDQLANTTTNLSEENYVFTSLVGDFENRFLLQFETENVLGTDANILNNIVVYPNPTKNILTISSPLSYIDRVEVFDIRGRRMAEDVEAEQNTFAVDLTGLETSVYFVKVITQEGTVTKKVIKE